MTESRPESDGKPPDDTSGADSGRTTRDGHGRRATGTADRTGRGATGATGGNWRPTRTSTLVVIAVSVVLSALLAARVAPVASVGLVAVVAASFAASLWLVDSDRWRAVTLALASVLALFVGAVFTLAVGYTGLSLVAALFPVERLATARANGLTVLSSMLTVAGAALAMTGALTAYGNVLREETIHDYADLAGKTFLVPATAAVYLVVSTGLSDLRNPERAAPIFRILASLLSTAVGAVLGPAPGRLHLLTFVGLLGVAAALFSRALSVLPVAELGTTDADVLVDAVDRAATAARWVAFAALFSLPVAVLGVLASPRFYVTLLTPPVHRAVASVTASHAVRWLLLWTALSSLAAVSAVRGLRRLARSSTREILVGAAPVVGGLTIVVVTSVVHRPLLETGIAFVGSTLPPVFADLFRATATDVLDYYGWLTVGVSLAAALVFLSSLLSAGTWLVMRAGYLPKTVAPPALASAGVFLAAAFAGASGVGAPLVVTGIVAAILLWDVGEFGVTLGREVGRTAHTRGTELVHLGSGIAVGAVGAAGVAGVVALTRAGLVTELTTVPLAVLGAVVGLVSLVLALR